MGGTKRQGPGRPRWDPEHEPEKRRWREAAGRWNLVRACYDTIELMDKNADDGLSDDDAIFDDFLLRRRAELTLEAEANDYCESLASKAPRGNFAREYLSNQPEFDEFYMAGFRLAARHLAELRRARSSHELGHATMKDHARLMAHEFRTGADLLRAGPPDPDSVRHEADKDRRLLERGARRYAQLHPPPAHLVELRRLLGMPNPEVPPQRPKKRKGRPRNARSSG